MIFKKISLLLLLTVLSIYAQEPRIYQQELKALKQSATYKIIFDEEDLPLGLHGIQRDIKNYKELSFFQRLVRSAFLNLDVIVVTPTAMPKLYSHIDRICTENAIATPTIFITTWNGFFNAAAQKLFISSGGIIIGQKLLDEISDRELEAVIAHEIGHIKHDHVNKTLLILFPTCFILKYISKCNTITAFLLSQVITDFIINKRFEKQADLFACETNNGQGLIEFFERLEQKDEAEDISFTDTYSLLCETKDNFSLRDYYLLHIRYKLSKMLHNINKGVKWVYHNTPYGAHPSAQARIAAAQEYLEHKE